DLIDNPTGEFKSWNNLNLIKSISEADLFVTIAPLMYETYKHHNPHSILVSNACEYHHYEPACNKLKRPTNFPNVGSKIVIGYYGAHSTWLDTQLVTQIANYKPDKYTVVMIGKIDTKDYNLCVSHPNITSIDHVSYEVLPQYLSYFDICMIPFDLSEMIRGCDPMKFYEYLAAGKPILTTKIEPILKFKDVCYFMDKNNYGKMIDKATSDLKNEELIQNRKMVAVSNNWDSKAEEIIQSLLSKNIKVTILFPPFVRWNMMFQRPQQMISSLSKKDGVRCVFIDYSVQDVQIKNYSLIISPSYDMARKYIKGKVILYYTHADIAKTLKLYKYDYCIYELVDNPVDEFEDWKTNLNLAINSANSVSITSMKMADCVTKLGKPYTLIPNGADYYHFERAQIKLKKPVDMPNISDRIIVGYYGAHASWVDWNLIKLIADLPYLHVVMIGRMDKSPYDMKFNHSNITWLPVKDYSELPYYLSWFDICMIPFKLTEMIKGCDPIKFYEYSSAGKPVMATKMNELQKYDNICYFIDDKNYNSVIKKIINEKDNIALKKKRQELAKSNMWDIRADEFLKMIPYSLN
ncbi:MAG: glycosyltransferase, partial [Homavirus sp.]